MPFTTLGCLDRYFQAIRPETDLETERFSPNLHRWLTTHRSLFMTVHFLQEPTGPRFTLDRTLPPLIYLGHMAEGFVIGSRLSEILRLGARAEIRAHLAGPEDVWQDITPGFWERYLEKGKCALDPEHELYADRDRYVATPDHPEVRRCRWCLRLDKVPPPRPSAWGGWSQQVRLAPALELA